MAISEEDMDNFQLIRKRLSLFMGSRLVKRKRVLEAVAIQDTLREKHSNISGEITGTDYIRKQRDSRK